MKFNGRNIFISPTAKLGSNVRVGDNAIIYDGVEIGDDSTICNNVVLGEPLAQYFKDPDYVNPVTIVGPGALIRSHTIIYAGCTLGDWIHDRSQGLHPRAHPYRRPLHGGNTLRYPGLCDNGQLLPLA